MYCPAALACAAYPAAVAWLSAHRASQRPPPVAGPQCQATTGAPRPLYPIPSRHRTNPDAAGGWISSVTATAG